MTSNEYQIAAYKNEHKDGVISLLAEFWSIDLAFAERYFCWRFVDNPLDEGIYISVALHDERVVGIRTASPAELSWGIDVNRIRVACIVETLVKPEFRGKGLFHDLTNHLLGRLRDSCFRFVLNMSASELVRRASLRNGWKGTGSIHLLSYHSTDQDESGRSVRSLDHLLNTETDVGSCAVRVSETCWPQQMADLTLKKAASGRIRLSQQADYIRWQYQNPGMEARFIYLYEKQPSTNEDGELFVPEKITGFITITSSKRQDNSSAWIADWEGLTGEDMIELLKFLIDKEAYSYIYFLKRIVSIEVSAAVTRLGFKEVADEKFFYWILSKSLSGDDKYVLENNRNLDNAAHWEHRATNLVFL